MEHCHFSLCNGSVVCVEGGMCMKVFTHHVSEKAELLQAVLSTQPTLQVTMDVWGLLCRGRFHNHSGEST